MPDPVPNVPDAKPPAGEAFVWFTGVGLLCGLAMVALLVGVIVTQGLQVFGTPAVAPRATHQMKPRARAPMTKAVITLSTWTMPPPTGWTLKLR